MQDEKVTDKMMYTAGMEFTSETIRKLTQMQYDTFSFGRKLGQGLASVLLIGMGLIMGSTIGVLALAVGCFLIVSLNYRPKNTADQICRSYKGKFPKLSYTFTSWGVSTSQVPEPVSFDRFVRLIDDGKYLYMYVNTATAFMIDKSTVKCGTADELKDSIAERSGLKWKKPNSILSLKLSSLKDAFCPGYVDRDSGFSGYRLDDHK